MDILDDELLNFWKTLNNCKVQYIMVGGFATNMHGFSRMTADLDIWIKDNSSNRISFRNALNQCDLGDYPEIEKMKFIAGFTSFHFNNGFELDVMTDLKGFTKMEFDSCYQMASIADIEGISVPFLHINHLIKEKESTARPKDLIDLEELKKIESERKNNE
jgi:hypothetical protein